LRATAVDSRTHNPNVPVTARRMRRTSTGCTSMRSCRDAASNVVTTGRAGIGTVSMSSCGEPVCPDGS